MKPALDWISEHGQSGEYPRVDEPIGCFTEPELVQVQQDAMEFCANELAKMASNFVGNTQPDGTRNYVVYEQGIGMELGVVMLRALSKMSTGWQLIEKDKVEK